MLITLKQKEIEAALRLYISQRGINLAGNEVEITFTAGRKETGVSAEVSIEGGAFVDSIQSPPADAQVLYNMALSAAGAGMSMGVELASIYAEPVPAAQPDPVPGPDVAATPLPVVEAAKKSVSLFN